MAARQRWSDLSPGRQRIIVALGVVQVSLMIGALIDIWRRPASQIRGPKRLWRTLAFVNWIGPISYFAIGRRRAA